jgi:hypothetical protein
MPEAKPVNDDEHDGLSAQERAALARQAASSDVPPGLEQNIIARLRELGEIHTVRPQRVRAWRLAAGIAAAVLVFAGGYWTAQRTQSVGVPPAQERWLLLLRGAGATSEAEHRHQAQLIGDWMREWIRRGVALDGEALREERWHFAAEGELPSVSEANLEPATGYFLLEGADLEHARAIGQSCPHLQMGGTIELRRVGM